MGLEKIACFGKSKALAKWMDACGAKFVPEMKMQKLTSIKGLQYKPLRTDTVEIASKSKNTVRMEQISEGNFKFYDGDQYIGKAKISPTLSDTAPKGMYPESWYIPNGVLDEANRLPVYPRLHVDEIIMSDKKGSFEKYLQRTGGKKYGTMCMQRILQYAEKNGFGSRITLEADKWGSNIHPGKFYAKIGFEPGPNGVKSAQKINERYYKGIEYAKKHPDMPEDIKWEYLERPFCEQIDGRFVADGEWVDSYLCLTHPEVLRNYPL